MAAHPRRLRTNGGGEVNDVTPEMIGAGMREWDKQHGAGIRSWPAMLEAVYVAMQAEDKRIAAALAVAVPDCEFDDLRKSSNRTDEEAPCLREALQKKCVDFGAYWRAPDAHGVELTHEQAVELLRDALLVEVEIKPAPVTVPAAYALIGHGFTADPYFQLCADEKALLAAVTEMFGTEPADDGEDMAASITEELLATGRHYAEDGSLWLHRLPNPAPAADSPGGDYIDRWLSLLKELEARGYGVFRFVKDAAPQPQASALEQIIRLAERGEGAAWSFRRGYAAIRDYARSRLMETGNLSPKAAAVPSIGQRVTVVGGFDVGRSGNVREIQGDEAIVALDYRYEGTRVPLKDLAWRKPEPPTGGE